MLRCKMSQHGWELFVNLFVPIVLAIFFIYQFIGLASGQIEDRDTTGRLFLEIFSLFGGLVFAPSFAIIGLNQWLYLSDGEVRLKSIRPFEVTHYWCPWGDVVKVRVWSSGIPSDPHSQIKKIVITRPACYVGKYHSFYLTINDRVPEIRQIMDFINLKIPDKVVWELQ